MLWNPENIAYKFMSECKRLWDLESPGRSRLTTVQAALVLNAMYNSNANDFIANRYLDQACEMAKALGMFGPARHHTSSNPYRARAITAWAVCKYTHSRSAELRMECMTKTCFARATACCDLPCILTPDEDREAS